MTIRRVGGTVLVACMLFTWGCGDSSTVEETIVSCQDGLDNDKNGLVDCKDPGCGKHSFCDPSVSKGCGDGVVTAPERCDTKIAVGSPGACPTSCDDGNACTKDSLGNPGTCSAACVAIPITACEGGDGCCPTGCDASKDSDCSASCGNGVLEPKETCDTKIAAGQPGACPTDATCDDKNACTLDAVLNKDTCNASCGHQAIIVCIAGKNDGCCPAGCNAATDPDCSASCGNGVLEPKETCDTKIGTGQVGACPTSCNDGQACTIDTLVNGGTCNATCTNTPISQCSGTTSDGCCPTGCNAASDADCSATCGNGIKEPKESCDTKIATGQPGACPTSCNDGVACTADTLLSAGTCNATCASVAITQCKNADGCCPAGCAGSTDSDCAAVCGNGVVELGEACDTKIAAGQPGACPTSCNDGQACTVDTLVSGGTCAASCAHTPVTACKGGDGCCAPGCNQLSDSDCNALCGNGVKESGEACDTKIAAGQPGACPAGCDDKNACTADTLSSAGTCAAICAYTPITACKSGDGCCPAACTGATDADCPPVCGNGIVDPGETCDTAIPEGPGACPSGCGDQNPCTLDVLLGSACTLQCSNLKNTSCSGTTSDGCCPGDCTALTDVDCGPVCGDGQVDPPETCDTAITTGPGACPQSCFDEDDCTTDTLLNAGTCTAQCSYPAVTTCSGSMSDGCCPTSCYFYSSDVDCLCGNGTVETWAGETCDIGSPNYRPGKPLPRTASSQPYCPTEYDCQYQGPPGCASLQNGGTCQAACLVITTCGLDDGCCPYMCNGCSDPGYDPNCIQGC